LDLKQQHGTGILLMLYDCFFLFRFIDEETNLFSIESIFDFQSKGPFYGKDNLSTYFIYPPDYTYYFGRSLYLISPQKKI
jgi:hypothetical protein